MKMFVVAANIFTVLMYLVYAFAFPVNDDKIGGKLFELYNTIMVFDIISSILVICQIMSGARRIEAINPGFGKIVRMQGIVFLVSNVVSAIAFYLLGKNLVVFGQMGFFSSLIFQLTFYGVTELLPIMSFVYVNRKFVEVVRAPAQVAPAAEPAANI